MSWDSSQDDVGWPLSDDITDCPGYNNVIVFVAVEVEIFLHAGDESIRDVRRIDPFDQHTERSERQKRGIEFEKKFPLFPRYIRGIPEPSFPAPGWSGRNN